MVANYKLDPQPVNSTGDIVAGDAKSRGMDKILLGSLAESGALRNLWLDISGEQVVAILGKRGTGKSYTLGVLLEGMASNAENNNLAKHETERGALVFDIMDIFWSSQIPLNDTAISREFQEQYKVMKKKGYSSYDLNVNILIPAGHENDKIDPPNVQLLRLRGSDLSVEDWGSLFDVDIYTEPRGMLIHDLVVYVSEEGYTDKDGNQIDAVADFSVNDLVACLNTSSAIANDFQDITIRSIRQRLGTYSRLPMFQGEPTPLENIVMNRTATVLMLGRVENSLKNVIVSVLLNRIMRDRSMSSLARKQLDLDPNLNNQKREELENTITNSIPRSWVLLDEAHVLAGTDESSVAKDALIRYAKEGRNHGMSLAVATQQPSALDTRLMSQAETLIMHQLTSPKDAEIGFHNIRSPLPDSIKIDGSVSDLKKLLRQLGQGSAIFSSGNAPNLKRACVVNIRPRISAHGGYEA